MVIRMDFDRFVRTYEIRYFSYEILFDRVGDFYVNAYNIFSTLN